MIEIKERNDTVYTYATGKLNDTDYDKIMPLLEKKLQEFDKINWYFQVEDFEGWTPKALWEDAKFDIKHATDLNKVAIVGEKKWQELMADAMKPFTTADVKYFDIKNSDKAKEWIS